MYIIQPPLFDFEAFMADEEDNHLVVVLEALGAEKLLATLEREHWTGRDGYPLRGMWSALIAGVVYDCESIAEVPRLLKRDKETRMLCGFCGKGQVPSEDALGRFLKKLVEHEELVEECFEGLVERLRQLLPYFGRKLAADSTDVKAWSNGRRAKPSDPDARWGAKGASHRETGMKGGGETEGKQKPKKGKVRDLYYWFGYKLHLLVDAIYELPVSYMVTPANESDTQQMPMLLEKAKVDDPEAKPEAVIADKGYDSKSNCRLIFEKYGAAPIIPLVDRPMKEQPDICNAKGTPTCSCGLEMVFWGRDGGYLKYRCPEAVGKAVCRSRVRCTDSAYGYVLKLSIAEDPRRHPPVPRESKKWDRLYRLRSAVERVNSRVKGLLGLGHIRVRGIAKVRVRTLLSLLVMLALAVGMVQRNRLKDLRTLVT
jgi:IS5 family transposase/transposase